MGTFSALLFIVVGCIPAALAQPLVLQLPQVSEELPPFPFGLFFGHYFDLTVTASSSLQINRLNFICTQLDDDLGNGTTFFLLRKDGTSDGFQFSDSSAIPGGPWEIVVPGATVDCPIFDDFEDIIENQNASTFDLSPYPQILAPGTTTGFALFLVDGEFAGFVSTIPDGLDAPPELVAPSASSDALLTYNGTLTSIIPFPDESSEEFLGPVSLYGSIAYEVRNVQGDPHLYFADGGQADFRGVDQRTYAMLSAPRVSLNMKIEEAEYQITGRIQVNGTFFDVAYYTLITRTGQVVRMEHGANDVDPVRLVEQCAASCKKADAKCDGEANLPLPAGAEVAFDDVTVRHVAHSDGTQALIVESDEWRITTSSQEIGSLKDVVKVLPRVWKATGKPKRQLDVSVVSLRDPLLPKAGDVVIAPHGILGQAYDGDDITVDGKQDNFGDLLRKTDKYPYREITTEAQAEGAIEGVLGDYEISCGFSVSFPFSRFNSTVAAPPRNVDKLTGTKRAKPYMWNEQVGAKGLNIELPKE